MFSRSPDLKNLRFVPVISNQFRSRLFLIFKQCLFKYGVNDKIMLHQYLQIFLRGQKSFGGELNSQQLTVEFGAGL